MRTVELAFTASSAICRAILSRRVRGELRRAVSELTGGIAGGSIYLSAIAVLRGNKPGHKYQSVSFVSSRRNVRNVLWSLHLGVTSVQFHSEETDLMHKSHSPSNGNRASPPQITPATDSYLELALAYAIESVLLEGGCYCQNLLRNGLAKNLSSLSTLLISCVGIPVSWCSPS